MAKNLNKTMKITEPVHTRLTKYKEKNGFCDFDFTINKLLIIAEAGANK